MAASRFFAVLCLYLRKILSFATFGGKGFRCKMKFMNILLNIDLGNENWTLWEQMEEMKRLVNVKKCGKFIEKNLQKNFFENFPLFFW